MGMKPEEIIDKLMKNVVEDVEWYVCSSGQLCIENISFKNGDVLELCSKGDIWVSDFYDGKTQEYLPIGEDLDDEYRSKDHQVCRNQLHCEYFGFHTRSWILGI